MKIHLRTIRPEGVTLSEVFPVPWVGLTNGDGFQFVAPLEVSIKVTKFDNELFVKGTTHSQYVSSCYRCLQDVNQGWESKFQITLDIEKHKEFIEIDADIRQEIILSLPTRSLCHADCRGLCVHCGVDLNQGACSCVPDSSETEVVSVTQ